MLENLVEYIGTRDGVELNIKDKESPATAKQLDLVLQLSEKVNGIEKLYEYEDFVNSPTKDNASALISSAIDNYYDLLGSKSNLVEYMGKRRGVDKMGEHGLFSVDGKPVDIKAVMKEVKNHDGYIRTNVLSLRREDAERLGMNNQEAWKNLLTSQMDSISENIGIPIDKLKIYGAFHNESHHPHMHFIFYSTDRGGKRLDVDGITKIKSGFAKEVFKDDLFHIYEEKNIRRDELRTYSKEKLQEIISRISEGSCKNEALEKMLIAFSEKLKHHKGRPQYGYLSKDLKTDVNNIVNEFAKDSRISELYNSWYDMQTAIIKMYKGEVPPAPRLSENEVFKPIKNAVIQEVLNINFLNSDTITPFEDDMPLEEMTDPESVFEPVISEMEDSPLDDVYSDRPPTIPTVGESEVTEDYESDYYVEWTDEYKEAKEFFYGSDTLKKNYEKAFSLLEQEAEAGNLYALYDVAAMYNAGTYVTKDEEKAQEIFKTLFNEFSNPQFYNNNIYVQYRLGKLYKNGWGKEQDFTQAAKWFSDVAGMNKSYSQYAQYTLGAFYFYGNGVEQNYKTAFSYYKQAAEHGNPFAQYEAAQMLYNGIWIDENTQLAQEYYKQAFTSFVSMAESTDEEQIHCKLGKMYFDGLGTDINIEKAVFHFEKAAKFKNSNAEYYLSKIYTDEKYGLLDAEKGLYWLLQSVEHENKFAQYRAGKIYFEGVITEKDIDKSLEFLNKSAEQGYDMAEYFLGKLYFTGEDVRKNIPKALKLLEQSAEKENQYAQYLLGKAYFFGIEVEKDIEKATDYLTRAAAQGNEYAQQILDYTPGGTNLFHLFKHLSKLIYDDCITDPKRFIKTEKKLLRKIAEKKEQQGIKM